MIVDEEIEMTVVAEQMNAEQTVVIDVERTHQLGCRLFYVVNVFHIQFPFFVVHIDGLHGLAVVGELDAGKQGGVCLYGVDDGGTQPLFVERLVELIQVGQVIADFSDTAGTFHVDAVLNF